MAMDGKFKIQYLNLFEIILNYKEKSDLNNQRAYFIYKNILIYHKKC